MSQKFNLLNILVFIKTRERFFILSEKIKKKLIRNSFKSISEEKLKIWIYSNAIKVEDYCKLIDSDLWNDTKGFSEGLTEQSSLKLKGINFHIGGGGAYPLLYFLTRKNKPKIILETGVAAGYSSYAFLQAISENGQGRLFSSDFPYFRIKNPEAYIGILVPELLRENWELFIKGDFYNFKEISNFEFDQIDLLHYDSDKSYQGRQFLLNYFESKIKKDTIIIFDDIIDNTHFYDLILSLKRNDWKIFEFEGKYLGAIGL
jgi:hypothetical protein